MSRQRVEDVIDMEPLVASGDAFTIDEVKRQWNSIRGDAKARRRYQEDYKRRLREAKQKLED